MNSTDMSLTFMKEHPIESIVVLIVFGIAMIIWFWVNSEIKWS